MSEYPVAYNGTDNGTGGNSLTEDLNIYYSVCLPQICDASYDWGHPN